MQYSVMNAVEWLPGTWHVQATNFPMWLKGDKLQPTFNYTALEDGRLLDEVNYRRKDGGEIESIVGYDQFDDEKNAFMWRGKGLLFIARSEWRVLHVSADGNSAIIMFSKTLFTAAGMDVITRYPEYNIDLKAYAADVFEASSVQPEPALKWLNEP